MPAAERPTAKRRSSPLYDTSSRMERDCSLGKLEYEDSVIILTLNTFAAIGTKLTPTPKHSHKPSLVAKVTLVAMVSYPSTLLHQHCKPLRSIAQSRNAILYDFAGAYTVAAGK